MKGYRWYRSVLCVFAALAFVGCGKASPTLEGTPDVPYIETVDESPIVPEDEVGADISPLGAPGQSTRRSEGAKINGILVVMDPRFSPDSRGGIYLNPLEDGAQGKIVVAPEVDPEEAYEATVDATTGEFAFVDIPPGRYHLLVVTPVGTLPVRSVMTGGIETLTVRAGQAIDLGRVQIP